MTADQIISAFRSGEWTPEFIITQSGHGLTILSKRYGLDRKQYTLTN